MARTRGARTSSRDTRVEAVRLVGRAGRSQSSVARTLGVSQSAVSRWVALARTGGLNALWEPQRARRARRVSDAQVRRLRALLRHPPEHLGMRPGGWTVAKIATLIDHEFDVRYHPSHVWKILRAHGVSYD